jgi:hypothetical protein
MIEAGAVTERPPRSSTIEMRLCLLQWVFARKVLQKCVRVGDLADVDKSASSLQTEPVESRTVSTRGCKREMARPLARRPRRLGRGERLLGGLLELAGRLVVARRLAWIVEARGELGVKLAAPLRRQPFEHRRAEEVMPQVGFASPRGEKAAFEKLVDCRRVPKHLAVGRASQQRAASGRLPGGRRRSRKLRAHRDGESPRPLPRKLCEQERISAGLPANMRDLVVGEMLVYEPDQLLRFVRPEALDGNDLAARRVRGAHCRLRSAIPPAGRGQQPDVRRQQREHRERVRIGPLQVIEQEHAVADPPPEGRRDRGGIASLKAAPHRALEREVRLPPEHREAAARQNSLLAIGDHAKQRRLSDPGLADHDHTPAPRERVSKRREFSSPP